MKANKNVFENNTKQQVIIIANDTHLSVSGNSISLQPELGFNPLIEWIEAYKNEELHIDINLDLINCKSIKLLLNAMLAVDNHKQIKRRSIIWYFKDEEDQELGEMIASSLHNTRFTFFCLN